MLKEDLVVDILMSTYNGEKYIEEQINSLLAQSYTNWHLIIRDDYSSDNTIQIIEKFQKQYPQKISIIKDDLKNLGINQSFFVLMQKSRADYLMFCDQDDFWLPDKIKLTLERMLELEKNQIDKQPALVFSDLKVVNENLKPIAESFWKIMSINPNNAKQINKIIVRNSVTGCTMMINKPLKNLIEKIPQTALIHDWWITLLACLFARISYINQPTILYRQHNNNVMGLGKKSKIKKLLTNPFKAFKELKNKEISFQIQAKQLLEIYREKIENNDTINILENYSNLYQKNYLIRIYKRIKFKFLTESWLHNIIILSF